MSNSSAIGNAQIGQLVATYQIGKGIVSGASSFGAGVIESVQPDPQALALPAVNTFKLAGRDMPGKWTLLKAEKRFGWQIQQGYYLDGAYIFPKGQQLVVSEFEGEIWTNNDWVAFSFVRAQLLSQAVQTVGKFLSGIAAAAGASDANSVTATNALKGLAMGIDHPELKALGCTAVVVGAVSAFTAKPQDCGSYRGRIEFIQFRPPTPAPPKPNQAIPDATTPPAIPMTAQQLELKANQMVIQSLSRLSDSYDAGQ